MVATAAASFGARLKSFRLSSGYSQTMLANKSGLDHSHVSRLESGTRTPTRDAIEQLADGLGLDMIDRDELLASAGYLPNRITSLLSRETEVEELLNLLQNHNLPTAYRDSMRQMVKLISSQARLLISQADERL